MAKIFRFFSGFYDSVKQRNVYFALKDTSESVPSQALKREYLWRLRFDILYRGSVVLTDAQFFDGPFFHLLSDEERLQLQNFMRYRIRDKYRLIDIRGRGENVDATLSKMLGKPFVFSSLLSNEQQNAVYRAMTNLPSRLSWDQILKDVHNVTHLPDVDQLQERMSSLKDVVKNSDTLAPWGPPDWFIQKWEELVAPLHKDIVNRMLDEGGSGQEEPENVLQDPLLYFLAVGRKNTFVRTDKSQEPIFPNRSEVDDAYRRVKIEQSILPEHSRIVDKISERFWQAYNSAIANQHGAGDVDIGESEKEDLLGSNNPDISSKWNKFNFVDDVTWEDFWKILSRSKQWEEWLQYRFSTTEYELPEIEKRQERLLDFLYKKFPADKSNATIWGGGSDMFKHKIKGFVSTMASRFKKVFSQLEFSVSISPNEQLNPTITLDSRIDHE